MARGFWLGALALFLTAVGSPLFADSEELVTKCKTSSKEAKETIECQLRTISGAKLHDVEITDQNDEDVAFEMEPYDWTKHESALYFLVQTSGFSAEQLRRASVFLTRAAYPTGLQGIGIYTVGDEIENEAPLGSYRPDLERVASSIAGRATSKSAPKLLENLKNAIDTAAAQPAERRGIFVLSDANPTTSNVDENAIVRRARRNNVALYFITFGKAGTNPAEILKTLAKKTNGMVFNLGDASDEELLDLASSIFSKLENGVITRIDAAGMPETIDLNISARLEGTDRRSSDDITVERITEDSPIVALRFFVKKNLVAVLAALGLLGGLLLIIRGQMPKKNQGATDSEPVTGGSGGAKSDKAKSSGSSDKSDNTSRRTKIAPSPDAQTIVATNPALLADDAKPVAWLQLMGANDPPIPLLVGNHKIGRGSENDIKLSEKSVHRKHAVIEVTDGGKVSVQDLDTRNGVFVNGVRAAKQDIQFGDEIELGDAKLRLIQKDQAGS